MNLKFLLVNLILTLFTLISFSQEKIQPVNISPFIEDTLDRVEREYFGLFPNIQNFQEAFWYFSYDSTFMTNVTMKYKEELIDTTFPSIYSLSYLRNRINGVLYKSIKDEKMKKQEITIGDSVYKGTIYAYRNNKLTLIHDCYLNDNLSINNDLISQINTSEIQTIRTKEPNFLTTLLTTTIGFIGFGAIGSSLATEKSVQETRYRTIYPPFGNPYTEEYSETRVEKDNKYAIILGVAGGILGYFIGQAIKYTVEYEMVDPKADEVIRENALLPSGINFTN
jgi:hypothetical protein